jgi:2-phospho-L-lactate guanylyltransferase
MTLVVVAHGDLPNARGLDRLGEPDRVTLVPDLREDGTNVAVVPAGAGFRFSYGPGSFERHRAEAARLGLACDIVRDVRLAADVDVPADLAHVGTEHLATIRLATARRAAPP